MTVPPPLSQGVDPRTVDAATQAIVSLCRTISDKIEVATIANDKGKILEIKARIIAISINFFNQR